MTNIFPNKIIIDEYELSCDEYLIDINHFASSIGYGKNNLPELINEEINTVLCEIKKLSKIKCGFKIFPASKVSFGKSNFIIEDKIFNCNKIIMNYLKDSETIAILVSTIGDDVEKWSKSLIENNEPLKGFLTYKIASDIVESTTDKLEIKLEELLNKFDVKITNRYSPGYCGWNVAEQQKIFSLLPERFCGVTLNNDSMMYPVKSVSAVIGIGSNSERKNYDCTNCDVEFCYKGNRFE